MALYYNGDYVSSINFTPQLTLAEYNALSVKPKYWIRTDAPESGTISANDISYSTGVTVKDKIDEVNGNVTTLNTKVNNMVNSITLGTWVQPAGNINVETYYRLITATAPSSGHYLIIGAAQALNGEITLGLYRGTTQDAGTIARTWQAPIRNIIAVAYLSANEMVSLWGWVKQTNYWYQDGANQYLILVKLKD